MPELFFYMDETGNRQPDKKSDKSREGRDWFGFGGIIIRREDRDAVRQMRDDIADELGARSPFHITDMLSEQKRFSWLGRLTQRERDEFWRKYTDFLGSLPVVGLGCIIDRPGYVGRGYVEKYPGQKWLLCRSAFDIAVERACKYARSQGAKLAVVFESDPPIDPVVKGYFQRLKTEGLGFNVERSEKYGPLTQAEFADTLTTIESRPKSNRLLQIADSYIYALARGKYDKRFGLWRELRDRGRVADFALGGDPAAIRAMGVKYYCFD